MTTRFSALLQLTASLAAITVLSGCATHSAPAPAADPAVAEDAEPLPPGVKPLTLEQEEAVAAETQ